MCNLLDGWIETVGSRTGLICPGNRTQPTQTTIALSSTNTNHHSLECTAQVWLRVATMVELRRVQVKQTTMLQQKLGVHGQSLCCSRVHRQRQLPGCRRSTKKHTSMYSQCQFEHNAHLPAALLHKTCQEAPKLPVRPQTTDDPARALPQQLSAAAVPAVWTLPATELWRPGASAPLHPSC